MKNNEAIIICEKCKNKIHIGLSFIGTEIQEYVFPRLQKTLKKVRMIKENGFYFFGKSSKLKGQFAPIYIIQKCGKCV